MCALELLMGIFWEIEIALLQPETIQQNKQLFLLFHRITHATATSSSSHTQYTPLTSHLCFNELILVHVTRSTVTHVQLQLQPMSTLVKRTGIVCLLF